ncbi:MAG: DnaJ family domain-containing protein [Pseudomonadota bacterium]
MFLVQRLAEEKIKSAIDRGEMDGLPGQGKPLKLDDNSCVPPELRAGFRVLKNAGYIPAELQVRREIEDAESLLLHVESESDARRIVQKISLLKSRLSTTGRESSLALQDHEYRQKLFRKLESREPGSA